MKLDIKSLLQFTIDKNASDLHLLADVQPTVRIDGELGPIPGIPIIDKETVKELVFQTMTTIQKDYFLQNKEIDYSINYGDRGRFRVNVYTQRSSTAAAFRLIPTNIKTIEDLGLPQVLHNFIELRSGFILVTGPTGHGKTTTIASIINEINKTRSCHIVTIEDPIEYVYKNDKSIISQREVNHDTYAWKIALRSVLREDPDVVLIGEMRDYETIAAALTIAETGHLVFATLHTNSAAQSIDRVVDVFPAHQQNQIRMQLSNTLEAVISQRLLPASDGGRVPAVEMLRGTSAVKTNIREGKTHLLDNIIQTSKDEGMITMDAYLAQLVAQNKITLEVAKQWCMYPNELMRKVKTGSSIENHPES